MANNTIGTKIVIDGEKEYREAIQNISKEQKELRSEMKLCNSTFAESQNSVDALNKKYEILTKQIEQQNRKVEIYSKARDEALTKEKESASVVSELQNKYENACKELEYMNDGTQESTKQMQAQQEAINAIKDKMTLATKSYEAAHKQTLYYNTALNDAQAELTSMNRQLEDTNGYLDEANKSSNKCAKSIDEFGNRTEEAGKKTKVFGDYLRAELFGDVIIEGGRKLCSIIEEISKTATETGSDFEAAMSNVAATMGMTAEEIDNGSANYEKLSNAAKECGANTKYSASEAAEALNYLALAGYDASKAAETLPKVLSLAAAGGMELSYASDLVTDSMAALGMETSELDKYIDEMARTSQKSNTSVSQLGEATLVCAGTVSLTGQELETMNTALGVMANNGLKGAEGGTHLRNILLSLSAPTSTAARTISELGINVSDSSGSMRNLNDIMVDMNASMSKLTDVEKTQKIKEIFNKTDIAAVNALLKGTNGEYSKLYDEINNCSGAAKDMADTMSNNLKGKIDNMQSALEGLGIAAYEVFDDDMKTAVQGATDAVGRLQTSIEKGDLGVSLNKLSNALGDATEGAVEFGEDALPFVIDGLTWILDNADLIISGIGGIVTANAGMTVVPKIIEGTSKAWEAYKLVTEGAATAQEALNITMNANPIGLIATAVAGLTGAMLIYAGLNRDAADATEKNVQALQDNKNALDSTREATEKNITYISQLKKEITSLNEKEKLSNEEKVKMKSLVAEINQVMPELSLSIDEHTGKLDKDTEALENNLDAALKNYEAQANQEELEEIVRQLSEAKKEQLEITKQQTEAQEKLAEAESQYNEIMQNTAEHYGESADIYSNAVAAEIRNIEDLNSKHQETQGIIDDLTQRYNELTGEMEEAKAETEELTAVTVEYGGRQYEIQGATQETVSAIENLQQAYYDAKEEAIESIEKQVGLFDELTVKSDLSVNQMSQNLNSQTEAFTQYKEDIIACEELVKKGLLDEGILGDIQKLNMDGAGYMHELATASEEEIRKITESFEEMNTAKNSLAEAIADMKTDYSDNMDEFLGIQTEKNELYKSAVSNTNEEVAELYQELATQTVEVTAQSMEEMNEAVTTGGEEMLLSVSELCTNTATQAETDLQIIDGKSLVFQTIGGSIPKGMAQGVRNGTSEFVKAVEDMLEKAVAAAVKKAEEAARRIDRALGSKMK